MSVAERGVTIKVDEVYIYGKDLSNVSILEEIDLTFSTLPVGTCDFTLLMQNDYYTLFTMNKAYDVYCDSKFIGRFFVVESNRIDNDKWLINGMNWLYYLDFEYTRLPIVAPLNFAESNAYEMFDQLLSQSSVNYWIDDFFKNVQVLAYIPVGEKIKDALAKLCLSYNASVANEQEGIRIISNNDVSANPTVVESQRIFEGQRIEENSKRIKSLTLTFLAKINQDGDGYSDEWPSLKVAGTSQYSINITSDMIGKEILFEASEDGRRYVNYTPLLAGFYASQSDYSLLNVTAKGAILIPYKVGIWRLTGKIFTEELIEKSEHIFRDSSVLSYESAKADGGMVVSLLNYEEVGERLLDAQNNSQKFACRIAERKFVEEGKLYKYGEMKYGEGKYGQRRASNVSYDSEINIGEKYTVDFQKYGLHTKTVERLQYSLNGNIKVKDCILV